jgi:acyl-CoA hydrolase
MKALVIYVGSSSLVIGIRVDAENVETRITKHTNTSYLTMVAKSDDRGVYSLLGGQRCVVRLAEPGVD